MSALSLYLTKKVSFTMVNISRSLLHTEWRKNSWHRYDMKKSRHGRPMYNKLTFTQNAQRR